MIGLLSLSVSSASVLFHFSLSLWLSIGSLYSQVFSLFCTFSSAFVTRVGAHFTHLPFPHQKFILSPSLPRPTGPSYESCHGRSTHLRPHVLMFYDSTFTFLATYVPTLVRHDKLPICARACALMTSVPLHVDGSQPPWAPPPPSIKETLVLLAKPGRLVRFELQVSGLWLVLR